MATGIARVWELYAKLDCLALALVAIVTACGDSSTARRVTAIPPSIQKTAVACLVLWLAVITSGRLIAYAVEARGAVLDADAVGSRSHHLLLNHFPDSRHDRRLGLFLLGLLNKSED
jgi:hypothetical protein